MTKVFTKKLVFTKNRSARTVENALPNVYLRRTTDFLTEGDIWHNKLAEFKCVTLASVR